MIVEYSELSDFIGQLKLKVADPIYFTILKNVRSSRVKVL
jgi:hypothetical protein